VTRPAGRALVVANPALQTQPMQLLHQLGFECHVAPDPYAAMAELCAAGASFRAVILSLQSFYREEIGMIGSVKRRFPHLDLWLTHTDGRAAAMAEAMRLGADGLLADDGLHRIASPVSDPLTRSPVESITIPTPMPSAAHPEDTLPEGAGDDTSVSEPVLTADELRALLQEQPSMPPASGSEN
jgi:hypothetical protein